MTLLRQFLGGYVALCVVFAGVIGVSPVLHQLIEHGGKGSAHTHFKLRPDHRSLPGHWHTHAEVSRKVPSRCALSREPQYHKLLVHGHKHFTLPLVDLSRVWHTIIHLLDWHGCPSPPRSPSGDDPSHEHQSLPQLLASGSVEHCIGSIEIGCAADSPPFRCFVPDSPFVQIPWNPQTASRGPPFALS